MISIAVTGSFCSGKSTVLKMLKKLGLKTMDSDKIVAKLYKTKKVWKKLEKAFGTHEKKEISKIVFADSNSMKKLEMIFHPLVLEEIKKNLFSLRKNKIVAVEIPLFFEAKEFQNLADFSVCVFCPKKQQVERAIKKGYTRKQALERINAQLSLKQKIKKSYFSINNNGTKAQTIKKLKEIIGVLECLK